MQNIKTLHLVKWSLIRNAIPQFTHMTVASTETTLGLSSVAVYIYLLKKSLNKRHTNTQRMAVITKDIKTVLLHINCRLAYLAFERGSGSSEFAKAEDFLPCPSACSYVPQISYPLYIFRVEYDVVVDPSGRAV